MSWKKVFGSLPKTLFFEYQTLEAICGYFMESYEERLREILNAKESIGIPEGINPSISPIKRPHKRRSPRSQVRPITTAPHTTSASQVIDIAIVGLSGRYPKARDLKEFWQNLRDGKDCITENPERTLGLQPVL